METHVKIILEKDPIVRRIFHHFYYQTKTPVTRRNEYISRVSKDLAIPEETAKNTLNFLLDSGLLEDYIVRRIFHHGVSNMLIGKEEYVFKVSRYLGTPEKEVKSKVKSLIDLEIIECFLGKSKNALKYLI
ncbi:MAG: hypothetical protein GTN36_01020 [Candidatus Aenigmarchaeota archaeon]|nr:hypothetical protein [Candidatus Aenigmarchaeota archaeon]